jgi:hypothetical protein
LPEEANWVEVKRLIRSERRRNLLQTN